MQEKIIFEIKTNLKEIAKTVETLSKDVNKLSRFFLKNNILLKKQNELEKKSDNNLRSIISNYDSLLKIVNSINKNKNKEINKNKESEDEKKKTTKLINKLNNNLSNFNDNDHEIKIHGISNTLNNFQESIINAILKSLDKIHKVGITLAQESFLLKPFVMEFMNSFSFNPLKFFGFGQAMKESFQIIQMFQQMKHEMGYLSDASGDASKAVSLVYRIAGKSAVASGTSRVITKNIVDQGIISQQSIEQIGVLSGNLQAATGIEGSKWGSFTAELAFNYGIPIQGLENITSSLIGTDIRGAQLERTMGTVNKVLQTSGFIAGKPTTDSVLKLTKSIGGSTKIFQALGISAEKAGVFIEGFLNPENFEKNYLLLDELGISPSKYAEYLNDVNGQKKLLDDTMENLPQVATKIMSVQNPYARSKLAKQFGLDMQMVRQMAGKTKGQIKDLLAEYESKNKANEALEAKKKYMASESAKFDDMMLELRLKVLGPIIKFLTKEQGLSKFISVLPNIAITIARIFQSLVPIIKVLTDTFNELTPVFLHVVTNFVAPFIKAFPNMLKHIMKKYLPFFNSKPLEESEAKKESSTKQLYVGFSSMLGYFSKIYFFMLAWKIGNAIFDTFKYIYEFFVPKSKKLFDTPFNVYLKEMDNLYKNKKSAGILSNFSIATKVAIGLLGFFTLSFIAKWITKKLFPPDIIKIRKDKFKTKEEISKEKLNSFLRKELLEKTISLIIPKSFGGTGISRLNKVFNLRNNSQNYMIVKELFKEVFNKKQMLKIVRKVFSKQGFIELLKSPFTFLQKTFLNASKSVSQYFSKTIESINSFSNKLFESKKLLASKTNIPIKTYLIEKIKAPFNNIMSSANTSTKRVFAGNSLLSRTGMAISMFGMMTSKSPAEFWGKAAGLSSSFVAGNIAATVSALVPPNPILKVVAGAFTYLAVVFASEYLGYNIAEALDLNKDVISFTNKISNNIERGITGFLRSFQNKDFQTTAEYARIVMTGLVNLVIEWLREESYFASLFLGRNELSEGSRILFDTFSKEKKAESESIISKYKGKIVFDDTKKLKEGEIKESDFRQLLKEKRNNLMKELATTIFGDFALELYIVKNASFNNFMNKIAIQNEKNEKRLNIIPMTLGATTDQGTALNYALDKIRQELSEGNALTIFKDSLLQDLLDLEADMTDELVLKRNKKKEHAEKNLDLQQKRYDDMKQVKERLIDILNNTIQTENNLQISTYSLR